MKSAFLQFSAVAFARGKILLMQTGSYAVCVALLVEVKHLLFVSVSSQEMTPISLKKRS
jgi:hypothetical protein